jgi:acetyl esterase/lipase
MLFIPPIDRQVPLTLRPGLEYGRAGGQPLLLDLISPGEPTDEPRPAAIWLHGGGWYAGGREGGPTYWCALLAAHGIVTASVDYRLSGDAVFPAQIHDVKAAIRWLRANAETNHIDPASAHSDFLAPGCDSDHPVLCQLFGGTRAEQPELRRLASPVAHIQAGAPPFLIAHGTLDETVPYDQAERLHAALTAAGTPAELVTIEGGYHNWNPKPDSTWPKVRYLEFAHLALEFFQRTL